MDIKDVLSIPFVAFMVFIFIALIMIGLGEYQHGAPRPGRVAMLPDHFSTEGARTVHNLPYKGGPPHYKEVSWK